VNYLRTGTITVLLKVRAVVTPRWPRVAVAFGYVAAVLLAMLLVEVLVDLWRYLF
jgi:hypothetical protein